MFYILDAPPYCVRVTDAPVSYKFSSIFFLMSFIRVYTLNFILEKKIESEPP